jgi:hypothetical protein
MRCLSDRERAGMKAHRIETSLTENGTLRISLSGDLGNA